MLFFFLKPCFFECPFSLLILLLFFYNLIDKPESHYNIFGIADSSEVILIVMLYTIFYVTVCANIIILSGEHLSDIFYIQCFFYPLLIVRMDGFTHPSINNGIKLECLAVSISDRPYIIAVVQSYNPCSSLSQVCNKYIPEALGQSVDNCKLFINLFLMGSLFFSFHFLHSLVFFNDVINILKSCYRYCGILIRPANVVLKIMEFSVHETAIIADKLFLGLEGLFYIIYRNCASDFLSILRVYNGINPILCNSFKRELLMILLARNIYIVCIQLENPRSPLLQIHPIDIFEMTSKRIKNHQLFSERLILSLTLNIKICFI